MTPCSPSPPPPSVTYYLNGPLRFHIMSIDVQQISLKTNILGHLSSDIFLFLTGSCELIRKYLILPKTSEWVGQRWSKRNSVFIKNHQTLKFSFEISATRLISYFFKLLNHIFKQQILCRFFFEIRNLILTKSPLVDNKT